MNLKIIGFIIFLLLGSAAVIPAQNSNVEILDSEKKYKLRWEVDLVKESVTFEVDVETTGFVGLGISPSGGMDGADIFIGGVKDGQPYFQDYHGVGHHPTLDKQSDWTFLEASENETHTSLKFTRLLNTCDQEDFPITKDTSRLIWAYGVTDDIGYHNSRRGVQSMNFLGLQPTFAQIPKSVRTWEMSSTRTMSSEETAYICTLHSSPPLTKKHHVIGYDALLPSEDAKKHIHHWIVYKCTVPSSEDANKIFGPFIGKEGTSCFTSPKNQTYPIRFCQESIFVWAIGGKMTLLPENIGYPIGEEDSNSYYMLEIHYNNPERRAGITIEAGVKIYYTEELRPIDGGLLGLGMIPTAQLVIPPNVKDFVVSSHCPSDCAQFLPTDGISIFSVLLHSHLAGRKLKVRHFRGGQELPWISSDEHYDFNFQQNIQLKKYVKYIPGDHLTLECVYDSMDRNGDVIVGGVTTTDEMCNAYLWYYPKLTTHRMDTCGSSYSWQAAMKDFEITNYTIDYDQQQPIIFSPKEFAGLDYRTILNSKYKWTPDFIENQRFLRRYGEQNLACRVNGTFYVGKSKYPEVKSEYRPVDTCTVTQAMTLASSGHYNVPRVPVYLALIALLSSIWREATFL